MNLQECINFLETNFPIDVFVEWTPSEYDMKYIYNTSRRLKKIVKDKEKNDKKRKDIINEQLNILIELKCLIQSINNVLPDDVASLFFNTIVWNINDLNHNHELYINKNTELRNKYYQHDNYYCIYNTIKKIIYCQKESGEYGVDMEKFKKYFDQVIQETKDPSIYTQEYCNIILKDGRDLIELEHNDIVLKYSNIDNCKRHELENIVKKLYNISNDIWKAMDCKTIVDWERENDWGVGGYYNGILKNTEGKRISLKSFIAGGYNIQRRHIRCRLTVLKN